MSAIKGSFFKYCYLRKLKRSTNDGIFTDFLSNDYQYTISRDFSGFLMRKLSILG